MQDIPRQKLVEIIARFGPQLCDDPKRCEGLLRDYCGEHNREITILVAAIREGVTFELRGSQGTIPHDVLLERCAQRLRSNVGVVPHLARWSVETWALALGVLTPNELTNLFRCPSCGAAGNSAMPIAGKSIKCPKCKARVRVSDDGRQFALETKSIADATSAATVIGTSQLHDPFAEATDPRGQLRQALRQIMADGVITEVEKVQIQNLRESLGISSKEAQQIFAQIKAESVPKSVPVATTVPVQSPSPQAISVASPVSTIPFAVVSQPRTTLKSEIQQRVSAPSLGLIVIGILGALLCAVGTLGAMVAETPRSTAGSSKAPIVAVYFLGSLVQCFVAFAGFQMKNLRNRQAAFAGSILAMLPCSACCVFGLPIGIWSLTVLNNSDVKQAFR